MTENKSLVTVYAEANRLLRLSLIKHIQKKWWQTRIDNSHLPSGWNNLDVHDRIFDKLSNSVTYENVIGTSFKAQLTFNEAVLLLIIDNYANTSYWNEFNLIDLENYNYQANTFKIEII